MPARKVRSCSGHPAWGSEKGLLQGVRASRAASRISHLITFVITLLWLVFPPHILRVQGEYLANNNAARIPKVLSTVSSISSRSQTVKFGNKPKSLCETCAVPGGTPSFSAGQALRLRLGTGPSCLRPLGAGFVGGCSTPATQTVVLAQTISSGRLEGLFAGLRLFRPAGCRHGGGWSSGSPELDFAGERDTATRKVLKFYCAAAKKRANSSMRCKKMGSPKAPLSTTSLYQRLEVELQPELDVTTLSRSTRLIPGCPCPPEWPSLRFRPRYRGCRW